MSDSNLLSNRALDNKMVPPKKRVGSLRKESDTNFQSAPVLESESMLQAMRADVMRTGTLETLNFPSTFDLAPKNSTITDTLGLQLDPNLLRYVDTPKAADNNNNNNTNNNNNHTNNNNLPAQENITKPPHLDLEAPDSGVKTPQDTQHDTARAPRSQRFASLSLFDSLQDVTAKTTTTKSFWSGLEARVVRFRRSRAARRLVVVRDNQLYQNFMLALTLFAVFCDDLRFVAVPKQHDPILDGLLFVAVGFFIIEILLGLLLDAKYVNSVLFYLDFLATASMVVAPILIANLNSTDARGLVLTRIARIIRIFRTMRGARITFGGVALVMDRSARDRQKKNNHNETDQQKKEKVEIPKQRLSALPTFFINKDQRPQQPKQQQPQQPQQLQQQLRRRASRRASRREMVLHEANSQFNPDDFNQNGMSLVGHALLRITANKIILSVVLLAVGLQLLEPAWFDRTVQTSMRGLEASFVHFNDTGCFEPDNACPNQNLCHIQTCCCAWEHVLETYSREVLLDDAFEGPTLRHLTIRGLTFFNYGVSDLRSIEILEDSTAIGSHVTADLRGVIATESVWNIAQTILIILLLLFFPLFFGSDISRLLIAPLEAIYDNIQDLATNPFNRKLKVKTLEKSRTYEIDAIQQAIDKLMKLLELGLGQAGGEIVSRNMNQKGDFNPLMDGHQVDAVFGFGDIRNFTDCCEILSEHTMIFTNQVARLVADNVVKSHGAVNKNIGDAFLMVWKISGARTVNEVAEFALRASVNIIEELPLREEIQKFALLPEIQERLGDEFAIQMGFGLHLGWAIEGAVGSSHKIDATYLSPHVNLTSRLESATKQYQVPLLMSHWFYECLPLSLQAYCRRIDRVTLKGSTQPVTLFTWVFAEQAHTRKASFDIVLASDEYMVQYVDGDWELCAKKLEQFLARWPEDKPALCLLDFIESLDFCPPSWWNGSRPIDK